MTPLVESNELAIEERVSECQAITRLSVAHQALCEARTLDEFLKVAAYAEALRACVKKAKLSLEIQNMAAEIKVRAEYQAGKILETDGPKQGGDRKSKSYDMTLISLDDLGITRNQSSDWQKMATLSQDDFEDHIRFVLKSGRELTSSGTLKHAKQKNSQQTIEPNWSSECGGDVIETLDELIQNGRKFRTIYADPPWQYGNQGTRASTDNHYGTMDIERICAEPVSQIVEDNAHLHLWTTNAFLFDAKTIIEKWGFTYKSCFVWIKPHMGIGNYWRVSHEFLLFGIRGNCPFRARDEMSWGEYPRSGHSAKPDEIREKIEKVSPGPYLEMYGRTEIPQSAWTVYGNQVSRRLV